MALVDIPVKKYSGPGAPPLPERDVHNLFIENAGRLRHCAIYGDHDQMSKILKNHANPCGADEFGGSKSCVAMNSFASSHVPHTTHTHCIVTRLISARHT
jgi:hypothetical protein